MKENIIKFTRTFTLTFILSFCPLMLFYGCIVADNNTRITGFNDTTPAVSAYTDSEGLHIKLFEGYYIIPEDVLGTAETVLGHIWIAVPPPVRTILELPLYLSGMIGQLVPWIRQWLSG